MILARVALALLHARNNWEAAAKYAEARWGLGPEYRALSTADAEGGGVLVGVEVDLDFARRLRSRTVVRRMGARSYPLSGGRRIVKVKSGSEVVWIGENSNIQATQPTLGALQFEGSKLAAFVPVSNSMYRHEPALTEVLVRDDMLDGIASAEDAAFLRGAGAEHIPRGMRWWAPDSHVSVATAPTTLTSVTDDLTKTMAAVEDADLPMIRPGWVFAPRTARFLRTLRDTSGSFVFKDEMAGGTLLGYPFGVTSAVPTDLGAGADESEVYFADFSELAIGDGPSTIDVAKSAAYIQDAELRAAFSEDSRCIRVITTRDFGARHPEAVAVLTGITWGA